MPKRLIRAILLPSDDSSSHDTPSVAVKADKDKEVEESYKNLRPMDRAVLIEKIRKDILKLAEKEAEEELEENEGKSKSTGELE